MKLYPTLLSICLSFALLLCLSACNPIETESHPQSETQTVLDDAATDESDTASRIHSTDSVMSTFFDITLFDEENYSQVYLGDDFEFDVTFAGSRFSVPAKITDLAQNGWNLTSGQNPDSPVLTLGSVDLTFEDPTGNKTSALLFNSTQKSEKLINADIVKFRFENNFYANPKSYASFHVNGINNGMAITDVIDILGTPSHFYRTAANNYYLHYSISRKDRRNGITVYLNTQEDTVTAVEITRYP